MSNMLYIQYLPINIRAYRTSIFSVFVRLEIICDVLSILERRTLARSFVLLVWLGFGWERLVVGNTIKRTKNGKQILKKSPQPSSRKWIQVCIEFLFIYKY